MPHKLFGWQARLPCVSEHKHNLSAYLDGELDRSVRAETQKHLARCQRCRAEYEQLRFASRATQHLIVPETQIPVWQVGERLSQQRSSPIMALERFWTMKVSVPVPVAAGILASIITVAVLFVLGQPNQRQRPVEPSLTGVSSPSTRFIEVPVEREVVVVRDRVVTRPIYVREPRKSATILPGSRATMPQPATLIGKQESVEGSATSINKVLFTPANLAGFRPAPNANLRIVKEPEQ